jgi:hypothetical protein
MEQVHEEEAKKGVTEREDKEEKLEAEEKEQ